MDSIIFFNHRRHTGLWVRCLLLVTCPFPWFDISCVGLLHGGRTFVPSIQKFRRWQPHHRNYSNRARWIFIHILVDRSTGGRGMVRNSEKRRNIIS